MNRYPEQGKNEKEAATHASVADSSLAIDPGLVRISVGVENAADLIND